MDFSTLEIIGLAFLSGLKIAEIVEDIKTEDEDKNEKKEETIKEGKHSKIEDKIEEVEIKKITPKEMGEILDNLKNKIIGEEK